MAPPQKIAPIVSVAPFNVITGSYATFINNVREALAGKNPDTVIGPKSKVARPVLNEPTKPVEQPPRWIHIELRGENGVAPKVAIRSDDGYITGFTNRDKKWFQLSKTGTAPLVDNKAVMAGFDGNYNTLLPTPRPGGVVNLPNLNLSHRRIAEAAAVLWNHKASLPGNDVDIVVDEETAIRRKIEVKEAVAMLAVAVCEAARYIPVSDVISRGWSKDRVTVTDKEVKFIKEWGDLSSALLNWRSKGYKDDKTIFQKFTSIKVSNGEQALAVVRLVKLVGRRTMAAATSYGDALTPTPTPTPTPTEQQLLAYAELPKHGRYMAEVLAVRIPATAGGDPPRGTISFHGGHCCSDFIYSSSPPEERSSSQQTCDSQGNIVLTGPSVATSAYDPIVFSLDLHDGQDIEAAADEKEVNNTGRIVCDAVGGNFFNYNRAISETVRTGYGPAEVIYSVLSNGVQARVGVKLAHIQPRDEEDCVFLGRIKARSKLLDVSCVLFSKEADNGVRVRPGELVPLARNALAVPLHMPLTIELDLRRCSGDEVVRGQLEFKTAIDGLHTERLVGVNGAEFEVTILWSEYPW